jgi:hypothetical protein
VYTLSHVLTLMPALRSGMKEVCKLPLGILMRKAKEQD